MSEPPLKLALEIWALRSASFCSGSVMYTYWTVKFDEVAGFRPEIW